jgi:hypothetical protein
MAVVVVLTLCYICLTRKGKVDSAKKKRNSVSNLDDSGVDLEGNKLSESMREKRRFIKKQMESGRMTRDLKILAK